MKSVSPKFGRLVPAAAAVLLMLGAYAPALAQNGARNSAANDDASAAQAGQTAGSTVDDTVITSKVKTGLLKDPAVKSLKISVGTENGNVTLGGKARNDSQIQRAVQIASSTKGVKTVTNNIAVAD